jgi:polysaccharide export outer membrane protein
MRYNKFIFTLNAAMVISGCAALPSSGPTTAQLEQTAESQNPLGIRIVPLNVQTINILNSVETNPLGEFSAASTTAGDGAIGIGDTLSISIFEAGNSLFSSSSPVISAAQTAGPSGSVSEINLPPEQVDDAGFVDIPYAGDVSAAGLTPDALGHRIEQALAGQSQNPQVIVTDAKPLADTIIISGAIHTSGRYPLTLAHERLLDMIAIAGGPTEDEQDVFVSLTRQGQSGRILMSALEDDPSQNVYLQPGDRIALSYDPRSFTVFGAAGKVQQVSFAAPQLNLAEALARAGGPSDGQADPSGVFVFRYENRDTADRMGLNANTASVPVIYQLDMMQPASYFYAQQFAMRDQDLLYIANAKTNRLAKLFNLIGSLVSPAGAINNLR